MAGIADWSVALPSNRLTRQSIVDAHGWADASLAGRRRGTRAVAWWDEDAITLGVEAVRGLDLDRAEAAGLILGGGALPFTERHSAAIMAEAVALSEDAATRDLSGGARAGLAALASAAEMAGDGPILAVAADMPVAQAGSARELTVGDGAVAFVVTTDPGRARLLEHRAVRFDIADRQRASGDAYGSGWEDRWARDVIWGVRVPAALDDAMQAWGLSSGDIAHLAMPCPYLRNAGKIAAGIGAALSDPDGTLAGALGDLGVAQAPLLLVAALEAAAPGDRILALAVGQGIDLLLLEATTAIRQAPERLVPALKGGKQVSDYQKLLRFRGLIDADTGLRGAQTASAAPSVLYRHSDMLTGFVGGRCAECGTVQFPRARYCVAANCRALDSQEPYPLAERSGTVASFTADLLSASPEPPSVYGMVDFDGGGRLMMDFADCDPETLHVGQTVRPVFRRRSVDAAGAPRYFWKAAPIQEESHGHRDP